MSENKENIQKENPMDTLREMMSDFPSPKYIKDMLDKVVIGQDDAKKVISVASDKKNQCNCKDCESGDINSIGIAHCKGSMRISKTVAAKEMNQIKAVKLFVTKILAFVTNTAFF